MGDGCWVIEMDFVFLPWFILSLFFFGIGKRWRQGICMHTYHGQRLQGGRRREEGGGECIYIYTAHLYIYMPKYPLLYSIVRYLSKRLTSLASPRRFLSPPPPLTLCCFSCTVRLVKERHLSSIALCGRERTWGNGGR